METKPLSNELIVQILREFVVEHSGKWVHPDICDKAAATIEALQAEVKNKNKKLRDARAQTCVACKHRDDPKARILCNTCMFNPKGSINGIYSTNNWEWNPDLDNPSPTSNDPLPMEALHGMAGKPYWHVGLRPESDPPHWAILPDIAAKYPQDYHYGEYWLAYLQETEEDSDENPDA